MGRDIPLQQTVLKWLMHTLNEMPKGKADYDKWISDGTVLVRALQCVHFNSVPIDCDLTGGQLENQKSQLQRQNTKDSLNLGTVDHERQKIIHDRIKVLINHLLDYGIQDKYIFRIEDLMELKNVPKVTRCIAMMAKLSGAKAFEDVEIEVPEEGCDEDVFED